jgi:hypothetical protein
MQKHVIYNLSYVTTMSNMIKKWLNMSLITSNQPNDSWH